MSYTRKKESIHNSIILIVLLFVVASCAKTDHVVFKNEVRKSYNGKTLEGCDLNSRNNNFEKTVIKRKLSNDIRITPCYWIDSLCYGLVDVEYRSEISGELLPIFIDQNGNVFELNNERKHFNKKTISTDEVIKELSPQNDTDSNFILARINVGNIYFAINRLMYTNIDSIDILKEHYVKEW